MKYSIGKTNLSKLLFCFAYISFIFYKIEINTYLTVKLKLLDNVLILFVCLFSLLSLITSKTKLSKNKVIVSSLVIVLFTLSYCFTKDLSIFLIGILLVSCKNISFDKLAKISAYTVLLSVLIVLLLSFLGYLPDNTYGHYINFLDKNIYAHTDGFLYYSNASSYIFFSSLLLAYLYRKKTIYIFALALNIYSYFRYTKLLCIGCIIAYFAFVAILNTFQNKNRRKNINLKSKLFSYFPYVSGLFIVAIVFMIGNNNGFSLYLNDLSSTRIWMSYLGLKKYGISLFGQYVEMAGSFSVATGLAKEYFYLDIEIMQLLIKYGLSVTILIYYLFSIMLSKAFKEKRNYLVSYSLTILLYSFINVSILNIAFCPILLYSMSCYGKKMLID